MVRNTVARSERRYKYYFERNAEGKWIPIPFDKSATASASAALDKPDDADESDDDLPIAERRVLAKGERKRFSLGQYDDNEPPEEKPELRRRIRYASTNGPPEEQPNASGRGLSYPEWYQGLLLDTNVTVVTKRDDKNVRCRLILGAQGKSVTRYYHSDACSPYDERFIAYFHEYEQTNYQDKKGFWPWALDKDLFDFVSIEVEEGRSVRLKRVKIILNEVTILDKDFDYRKISGRFSLAKDIREYRLNSVPHTDNPVIRRVALELGKAWHPEYGGIWDFAEDIEAHGFSHRPQDWCSEFAAWAIRRATSLNPPEHVHGNTDLARYFCGLWRGTDLARGFDGYAEKVTIPLPNNIVTNRFITPNRIFIVGDSDRSGDPDDDGIRNRLALRTVRDILPEELREWKSPGGIPATYYGGSNPNYCSWEQLGRRIEPGYYVKMRRGRKIDGKQTGHSSFFLRWYPDFDPSASSGLFQAIGGNQDERVRILTYNISKNSNGGTRYQPWDPIHAGKYGKFQLNDIYWKASHRAQDEYGYPDGFGITDLPPPSHIHKPKLEIG